MTAAPAASLPDSSADIVIRTPGVGAAEIAAVTAVLAAITASPSGPAVVPAVPTAWSRGQRAIRTPLIPGAGRWRSFEG